MNSVEYRVLVAPDSGQDSVGATLSALDAEEHFLSPASSVLALENFPLQKQTNYTTARVRALLSVPTSGTYRLAISGDDEAELHLGATASASSSSLVAKFVSWKAPGDWTGEPTQLSRPIVLEAGHQYWFELKWLQLDGGGFVDVGYVTGEEGTNIERLPADWLRAAPPDPADADRDGLPDDWERAHNFRTDIAGGADGPVFDNDEDGLSNLREFQLGRDPWVADTVGQAGLARLTRWSDAPFRYLTDFRQGKRAESAPSANTWVTTVRS